MADKWEYRERVFVPHEQLNVKDALAEMGEGGWELVAVVAADIPKVGDALYFYFKRPKRTPGRT